MTKAPKKAHTHSHEKKVSHFVEKVIGYDGVNDGLRPLRLSVILSTLLSVLVVSIITYFIGRNY
jgi:hypothetical protein